jgi:hypothetical protein
MSQASLNVFANISYLRESDAHLNFQNPETKESIFWRM